MKAKADFPDKYRPEILEGIIERSGGKARNALFLLQQKVMQLT